MKVWFVNSARGLGGGELWMLKAARVLQKSGCEIAIVGRRNGGMTQQAAAQGLPVFTAGFGCDYAIPTIYRLRRIMRRERPDVIVCGFNRDLRTAGVAARSVRGMRVVARHGLALISNSARHRRTMRLADAILTNSRAVAEYYAGFGWMPPDFVKVIHNGVEDLANAPAHDFSTDFPGEQIVLAAGRLVPQKGFDVLLRAFANVRKQRPAARLVIAGDGPERESLRRLNQQLGADARFIGRVDNLPSLLRGCDLFVLSSRYEGMPNVVLEAMSAGCAVVAASVQGVGELVDDGKTGLLVSPEDPATLREAILRLLSDDALRQRMGDAGQTRVREHFNMARFSDELMAWLEELTCR